MTPLQRYGAVLRPPGARSALAASLVGRLSLAMTGLGLLLLVRKTTGSYAQAGAVSASYALALAIVAPRLARSADRRGPRGMLVRCGLVHPVALVGLVPLAVGDAALPLLLGMAAIAGASAPPMGPVMRSLWAGLLSAEQVPTAYALEAVVVELCFIVGPSLVAFLTAVQGPESAVIAAALVASTGALSLAAMPVLRAVVPHPERHTSLLGPLTSPAVRALLVTVFGVGVGFGAVEVAVPAFVEEQGSRPGIAGVVLALWAFGSVLGGLAYGARPSARPPQRQLPVLAAALAIGSALPLLATSVPALCLLVLLYGVTIAPFSACNSVLLGRSAPAGTTTEAFAWSGTMIFGGAALGSALGGVLVEASGTTAAFLVAAGGGALALVSGVVGRLPVDPVDSLPDPHVTAS